MLATDSQQHDKLPNLGKDNHEAGIAVFDIRLGWQDSEGYATAS
jgi:hypothetical protein